MRKLNGNSIVFLPGLDGTGISFEPFRQSVAADARVTVVRYPNDEPLSFQETVDCAAEQVSSDDVPVVVAESFSGPVAIELIGSGRLQAKCLVLCATFARSPRPLLLRIGECLPLSAILGLPLPEAILRLPLGGPELAEFLLPLWHRVRGLVPPRVLAHRLRLVSRVDVRHWLPKLSLPCLYLQASADIFVPASSVLDFVVAVPHLKVKTIAGPHFILQAKPQQCAAAMEELRALPASRWRSSPMTPAGSSRSASA